MSRAIQHLRSNAIAYLALFVALGGTSYAVINLPANSVGARQIKNQSITRVKLDPSSIAGSIRYWAKIDSKGHVIASRPRARTLGWGTSGLISWGQNVPRNCAPVATVDTFDGMFPNPGGFASADTGGAETEVHMFDQTGKPTPEPVNIVIVCS